MFKRRIKIVGLQGLQNGLLARFLEKENGAEYTCSTGRHWNWDEPGSPGENDLTLLDFQDFAWEDLSFLLSARSDSAPPLPFALFNVYPDYDSKVLTQKLFDHGLRGVFDKGGPLRLINSGIRAMFNGELWIPRKILADHLLAPECSAPRRKRVNSNSGARAKIRLLKKA